MDLRKLAEGEGFEPSRDRFRSTGFRTAAIDHEIAGGAERQPLLVGQRGPHERVCGAGLLACLRAPILQG